MIEFSKDFRHFRHKFRHFREFRHFGRTAENEMYLSHVPFGDDLSCVTRFTGPRP